MPSDRDYADLVRRLRPLGTSAVSDVLDRCGYRHQALASDIRPLAPGMRLAGPAACFAGAPEDGKTKSALSPYEMDRHAAAGTVIVVATRGQTAGSVAGGLMCLGFQLAGCAGLLVDGGLRDASEIAEMGFPAFARFWTPAAGGGRWALTEVGVTVELPGAEGIPVTIAPGDVVLGDEDGVIIVPQAILPEVVEWSERLVAIEAAITARMRAGDTREAAFAANPRFDHIRRLR